MSNETQGFSWAKLASLFGYTQKLVWRSVDVVMAFFNADQNLVTKHAQDGPASKRFFGTTLDRQMALQACSHPGLALPWVFVFLLQTIRELGGAHREGIFRLSGNKDQMIALRERFEAGDTSMQCSEVDLDVATSMLKEWLRDLQEPVIPTRFYNECIQAATDIAPPELAGAALQIFDQMPNLSREVLLELSRLCVEIEANAAENKMNIGNLAVVFGPTVLINPTTDCVLMFANNHIETAFTASLFRSLASRR